MKTEQVLLLLALSGAVMAGSEPGGWDTVVQVPRDTRVEVVYGNLQRATGGLREATDGNITVQTETGPRTIQRAEVRRVSLLTRSRKKRAIIGAALGAGLGAAVLTLGASAGDIDIQRGIIATAGAAFGGTAGATWGALSGGPRTIYRAP